MVDSHTFIQDYSSRAALAARPDLGEGGGLRPVVDLLVEQIEWVACSKRAVFVCFRACSWGVLVGQGGWVAGKEEAPGCGRDVCL